MAKSLGEQAVARVGKRPQTATQLAQKLGLKGHQAIARELGKATAEGRIVRTEKGYTKA